MTESKSSKLVEAVVYGLQDKKAVDIVTIDLRGVENTLCEYFVICNGTSNTHVDALANSAIDSVYNTCKDKPIYVDGKENSLWILIDYADVMVHVFQKEHRDLYQLEDLWLDGKSTHITED